MTRFFILITLLTALLLPSAALAAQAPQTATVTVATLNIRAGPSAASALLGQAHQGDALPKLGANADSTWLHVALPDDQAAPAFAR